MNNEFEEMRQQMNILKEKLQQQDIVNEKVMRRTMKRNVSGINRRYTFVSILCILMIPYSYWAFVSLTGMSIYFWAATSVFMLLCFGYTVYNGRHLNSRLFSKDLLKARTEVANAKKLDSLQVQLENQEWMVATMQAVLRGEELGETQQMDSSTTLQQVATVYRRSKEDSLLRLEVEREDNLYQVKSNNSGSAAATVVDASPAITHLFFTPLKGNILTPYSREHYGVDIAGEAGHAVCAAYSGTVLFSGFTAEAGQTLTIQHPGNVVTVYRNCSSLLVRQGDAVRAGAPVAYVGNNGRRELGPYLHFEIWVNGAAVNPEEYISF